MYISSSKIQKVHIIKKKKTKIKFLIDYNPTSAQREHDKNVSVFVRGMCITPRKIVKNYCFKECSNKYCLQTIMHFLMHLITFRNSRSTYIHN